MQLVDGSSDVYAVEGAVRGVCCLSLLAPLLFSGAYGPSGEHTSGTDFPLFLSRPCPFASFPRWRTKEASLMTRVRTLPRVVAD